MNAVERRLPAPPESPNPPRTQTDTGDTHATLSYRRSERTTIYIRTQEGDTVRLKIKLREAVRAEASQAGGEDAASPSTEVELRARASAKIALFVDGDLNAAEREAIASVLDQASALADEFFSGDFEAAFAAAAGFAIDGAQLSTVALKMSVREQLTYTHVGLPRVVPLPSPAPTELGTRESPTPAPAQTLPPPVTPSPAETADPAPVDAPTPTGTTSDDAQPATPSATPAEPTSPAPTADATALMAGVLRTISDFLGHVLDAFDDSPLRTGDGQIRLDMSLKIKLLASVLVARSDGGVAAGAATADDAAPTAPSAPALLGDALDNLAAARHPRLLDVA